MPKDKFVNVPCALLTQGENTMLFGSTGHSNIAIAIVELHRTYEPNHDMWFREFTGILCFIYDKNLRNFFMRMYSLIGYDRVWEFRVPYWLGYVETIPYFHQFEGKDCVFGFNFCSEHEAKLFSKTVNDVLKKLTKIKNKARKRSKATRQKSTASRPVISGPTDFRHVEHYGLDKYRGLVENLDSLQTTFPRRRKTLSINTIQQQPEVNLIQEEEPASIGDYEKYEQGNCQPSDTDQSYNEQQEIPAQNNLLDEIRKTTLKPRISRSSSECKGNTINNCPPTNESDSIDSLRNALGKIMQANFGMYDDNDDYSVIDEDSDWDE